MRTILWEEALASFNACFEIVVNGLRYRSFDITSEQFMRFYTTFHIVCNQNHPHDHSHRLYLRCREALAEYFNDRVLPSITKHGDTEGILKEFAKQANRLGRLSRRVSHLLSYIDTFYIKRGPFLTVKELSNKCFRDVVFPVIQSNLYAALIRRINRDRQGENIDRKLLRTVICVSFELGMGNLENYETGLESLILQDAAERYLDKASALISSAYECDNVFLSYLPKYELFLEEEKERVTHYLFTSSVPKLIGTLQHQFLIVVANNFLKDTQSGFPAWLRDEEVVNLSKIYTLFHDFPEGLANVVELFKQHVTAEGNTLFKRAEEDAENRGHVREQGLFRNICKLHDKSMDYVTNCFQNHSLFSKALNEIFDGFCNKTVAGRSTAELLATYFHNSLKNYLNKKGISKEEEGRESPEKAMENTIENVMKFLRHSRDRDLFAKFHQKKLVERLLFDRSSSTGYEDSMLLKFREEFGAEQSSHMEKMMFCLTIHASQTSALLC